MKSTRWIMTYIVMASVGLWVAFFMSLKFMTPGHSQTPPADAQAQKIQPPSAGDLPPEFAQEAQAPGNGAPAGQAQGNADANKIPPPPTQPPVEPQNQQAPPAGAAENAPPPPPPGVPPTAATPAMVPPTVQVENTAPIVPQFASDDQYTYDPTGRRDPFKPYKSFRPITTPSAGPTKAVDLADPLQRWDLDRFNVVAIMWEIRHPKAMVKDPDGKMYMIGKNTKIGRNSGQVVAIREGEVVVVETIDNEGVQTKEVKILELKK